MIWLITSIFSGLMAIIAAIVTTQDSSSNNIAVIVVMTLLFIFSTIKYKNSKNPERRIKKQQRQNEKFEKEKMLPGTKARKEYLGADLCIMAKHMAGLPLAEGAEVFIYRCPNKVIFERNQDTIELNIDKVRDILIKTDVEIQKSYSSSVGGAVGGYVLFGPLGAMVGGRRKEKESTVTEEFLIFSYITKENKQEYISFDVTNEPRATSFNAKYYNLMNNERVTVEL
ncbi:hypothetical protein CHH80_10825 [Bacillus sp. 7504-2]|nr:hypothetical protein CHH80_10825 [Bacillus sp. 7504-2]